MTDLEMTRLCAEAIGISTVPPPKGYEDLIIIAGLSAPYVPLHDDAQAMALVKKFKLELRCVMEHWHAWYSDEAGAVLSTNLNRAIVECVAQMQSAALSTSGQHKEKA